MKRKLSEILNYIDEQMGDTDPFIDPELSDQEMYDIIMEEEPLMFIHMKLVELIEDLG